MKEDELEDYSSGRIEFVFRRSGPEDIYGRRKRICDLHKPGADLRSAEHGTELG